MIGPPTKTSIEMVSPIVRPATALNAPRGSTAVAKTAPTRKNVRIISSAMPRPAPKPDFSVGTEPSIAGMWKNQRSSTAAKAAPPNCATQ